MSGLYDNHRKRMRFRYRHYGLDNFDDFEVLEMLLFYCYPRRDTNQIAHSMISAFGSLDNLLDADIDTLMERLGCTESIAAFLNMLPKVAHRYFHNKWSPGVVINNEKKAGEYAIDLFIGSSVEKFYVLCFNKKMKLINTVLISEGVVDETSPYPRKIVSAAIHNNATKLLLTHNHPGGLLSPSKPDIETTRVMCECLATINIPVIDHIIVAGDQYYSFAAKGSRLVSGYD